jgi:DNA-binding PadR family transcriptional regulator
MARRRPGVLLPLEIDILDRAASSPSSDAAAGFHGFLMAKWLRADSGARRLTGHGTLYKALGRLETAGLLESWWEDAGVAAFDGRPRRRLYRVTPAGRAALAAALARAPSSAWRTAVDPT